MNNGTAEARDKSNLQNVSGQKIDSKKEKRFSLEQTANASHKKQKGVFSID